MGPWKQRKIALHYLPAYSPEEHVNADVKKGVGEQSPKKTKESVGMAAEEQMKMLHQTAQRIMKYFEDAAISYAAWFMYFIAGSVMCW